MSVTLQQFIDAWTGKQVPSRGGITGQCVSLVQHWAEDRGVPGAPVFPVAYAYLMAGKRPDYFNWVANTPNGVPSPGDIVVWNSSWGGGAGHTGVVVSANTDTLDVFQQNDPTGSGARIKRYTYAGVIGWLQFKNATIPSGGNTMADIVTTDELRIIHSELEGWPLVETHQGKYDAQFNASWGGQPLRTVLWDKWNKNANYRAVRERNRIFYDTYAQVIADLPNRPTKAQLDEALAKLADEAKKVEAANAKVAELEKQVKENPDTVLLDQSGGWLKQLWARLFGGK